MKLLVWNELDEGARRAALLRPEQRSAPGLRAGVRKIAGDVRAGGWENLCQIARRIDGEEPRLEAVEPLAAKARASLEPDAIAAIETAARNIRTFHEASLPSDLAIETSPGLMVRKLWRSIDRVGIYIPGGRTPLFSTLLMLAIPAQVAGVREIVAVTPPNSKNGLDPIIALAAQICGIEAIWTLGGAQAIAALGYGAGPIVKVDKICGPGNAWVAEAKRLIASEPGGPAIDMPAGPSELMVIADDQANAGLVAADLLSQAEHDPAAQVLLATNCLALVRKVEQALEEQLASLPREAIARESLSSARLIVTGDLEQAVHIANLYAPEHLSLAIVDAEALIPRIRNAGAVFAGSFAAETFGDYLAGSSHVLPTDGAARAWGGVSVHTFLKAMSVQTVTKDAARQIAPAAALMARMEALEAHARAADARLELAQ